MAALGWICIQGS